MRSLLYLFLLIPSVARLQPVIPYQLDSSASKGSNLSIPESEWLIDTSVVSENLRAIQFLSQQEPSPLLNRLQGMPLINYYQVPRSGVADGWMTAILFLLLIMLAIIRVVYSREFSELGAVFKYWGANQQVFRELIGGISAGTILLNIFSVASVAFYLMLVIIHAIPDITVNGYILFTALLSAVAAYMLIRYIALKMAAAILPFHKEINLYNYYEMESNRLLGVLLFPFLLLLTFAPGLVSNAAWYASYAVMATMLLIRYIKGMNIGRHQSGKNAAHIFLYICALEIAPVLIIIRLVSGIGFFEKA